MLDSESRIFQIIETQAAHYTENEAGTVMICLTSLCDGFKRRGAGKSTLVKD